MKRLLAMLLCMLTIGWFAPATAESTNPIQYLTDMENLPELCRDDLLEVHFISVGAADSILLRMGKSAVLVDSGRRGDASKVVSYLKNIGVETLDCVFLTHPHDDHIGGFPDILMEIAAGAFYKAGLYESFESAALSKLNRTLVERQILDFIIPIDWTMRLGAATLSFYQWQNPDAYQNDRSLMIKVEYGERSVLLTADVENSGQKALAAEHGERLRADILKMPHHGIGTYQLPFHEAVQPMLGVVSNSKNRIQKTIDVMTRRGMQWLLTTRGTVVAVSDGNVWTVWQISENY